MYDLKCSDDLKGIGAKSGLEYRGCDFQLNLLYLCTICSHHNESSTGIDDQLRVYFRPRISSVSTTHAEHIR